MKRGSVDCMREFRSSIGMEKLAGYVFEGDDGFSPGFGVGGFRSTDASFFARIVEVVFRVQNSLRLFALVNP